MENKKSKLEQDGVRIRVDHLWHLKGMQLRCVGDHHRPKWYHEFRGSELPTPSPPPPRRPLCPTKCGYRAEFPPQTLGLPMFWLHSSSVPAIFLQSSCNCNCNVLVLYNIPGLFLQCSLTNVPGMFKQHSSNIPAMFLQCCNSVWAIIWQCSLNIPAMLLHCSCNFPVFYNNIAECSCNVPGHDCLCWQMVLGSTLVELVCYQTMSWRKRTRGRRTSACVTHSQLSLARCRNSKQNQDHVCSEQWDFDPWNRHIIK